MRSRRRTTNLSQLLHSVLSPFIYFYSSLIGFIFFSLSSIPSDSFSPSFLSPQMSPQNTSQGGTVVLSNRFRQNVKSQENPSTINEPIISHMSYQSFIVFYLQETCQLCVWPPDRGFSRPTKTPGRYVNPEQNLYSRPRWFKCWLNGHESMCDLMSLNKSCLRRTLYISMKEDL